MSKHPVPNNVYPVNTLDAYMVTAITDTTKGDPKNPEMRALQFEISRDKQMETLEKKAGTSLVLWQPSSD